MAPRNIRKNHPVRVARSERWSFGARAYPPGTCVRRTNTRKRKRGSTLEQHRSTSRIVLSTRFAFLFPALMLVAACSGTPAPRATPTPHFPPLPPQAPVTAVPGPPRDDWTTFAHDQFRSGFQPQPVPFGKANVARLHLRWKFQTGDGLQASPLVANGRVYVANSRGVVRALDARTGAQLWQVATGATIAMTPALADGMLFVGDHRQPGALMALDATNGTRRWQTVFPGGVRSEPAIANGIVYIGEPGGDQCFPGGGPAWRE